MIGTKTRKMSLKTRQARSPSGAGCCALPRTDAPPGNLHFIRYPWVVSNEKLKSTTGWEPKYDTRETFEITMRARGLLGRRSRRGRSGPDATPVGSPPAAEPAANFRAPPGRIAQLGERRLDKAEVTGSSPVTPIASDLIGGPA